MPVPRVPPNRWPPAPTPPPTPPQRNLDLVLVQVLCPEINERGWELENTEFEVVPRVGEEINVPVKRMRNGVGTHTTESLIVEQVIHYQASVNGHRNAGPNILLRARRGPDANQLLS
jgi:hypothetical protein